VETGATLLDKRTLSERDICAKYITPAVRRAGWDVMSQIGEEVSFTKGRIIVRDKLVTRGQAKRADYVLYYKPNIPLALIEAKDNICANPKRSVLPTSATTSPASSASCANLFGNVIAR
jgi:type I site-specific restriction endonuclease